MPVASHRRFTRRFAVGLLFTVCVLTEAPRLLTAQSGAQGAASAAADSRLDWWRDARFGMFIHWGLYALPGGEWEGTWTEPRGRDLYQYVRALQPSLIVNNRVGAGSGDFGTPEQEIPATGLPGSPDWETCMTMNRNWGFNRADKDFKTTQTLVRNLVDIASKGGNFLLNVGPTAEGEFPPESVTRLKEIGDFMRDAGESIYGTSASPFPALPWGRCTQRRLDANTTRLYLHVLSRPEDGRLIVPGLLNDVLHARKLPLRPTPFDYMIERKGDDVHIGLGLVTYISAMPADEVIAVDIVGEPRVKPTK